MYSRNYYFASNPLGVSGNSDRLAFAPFFIFKDLVTIFIFIWVLSIFVFFMPNVLGDSENYVIKKRSVIFLVTVRMNFWLQKKKNHQIAGKPQSYHNQSSIVI